MDMLQITFHEGIGLAGGFFGTKDPYIVATMGSQKVHTNVVKNGGKNPKWEQTFTIPYEGEDAIFIQVFDKDTVGKDDVMGEGRMDLVPLRSQRRWTTNLPIEKKKSAAGTIRVSVLLKEGRPVHNDASPPQHSYHLPAALPAQAPPVYQQMPSYPGPGYHQSPAGYGVPPAHGGYYPPGPPPGHYPHPHGPPPGHYPPGPGYGGPGGYPGPYPHY